MHLVELSCATAFVPSSGSFVPASHSRHDASVSALYRPAAQMTHLSSEFDPNSVDCRPAGHNLHVYNPCSSPYLPSGHDTHGVVPHRLPY